MKLSHIRLYALCGLVLSGSGCFSEEPKGLAEAPLRSTTVKFDLLHKPLPEIPLPNNIATRYDPTSATGRRINASLIAPTTMEGRLRRKMAQIDGFGVLEPITIPFTAPLDVASILAGHRDANYDTSNDVVYLINVDRNSPEFGKLHHLDVGNGNYPVILELRDRYWGNDPRGDTISLLFEEVDEDLNGNGVLDPGEDTDADGVLDKPNYLPGANPAADDLAGRADALMTFYERETNTLIVKPLVPLRQRTTYAVVVTTRIKDAKGESVGSPFASINHVGQNEELAPLPEVLPSDLALSDVAFAFSFTTQSIQTGWQAVRDGLYGHGVQAHLASEFPPEITSLDVLRDKEKFPGAKLHILYMEHFVEAMKTIATDLMDVKEDSLAYTRLMGHLQYIDYFVMGSFESAQLFQRKDADGNPLPFDEQSWPEDLDQRPVKARSETVYFWLAVPRKETSARGRGEPAPVAFITHGYTGYRVDLLNHCGTMAKHGLASLAIDGPSHGFRLSELEEAVMRAIFKRFGLSAFSEAVLKGRSTDMNGDGVKDSGADFWSSYMFHTRDMLRQYMFDLMQLVRIVRSFDGSRGWKFGIGDRIAGDFDGDGFIDIGGDALITIAGGSLGGMTSFLLGALEPQVSAVVPIAGGGGLSEIGTRSRQGGVPEAFILRTMGPLFLGTPSEDGKTELTTIVPDLNEEAVVPFGKIDALEEGDSVVVRNLATGERGCGRVAAAGTFRVSVATNKGDPLSLTVYRGEVLSGTECEVAADAVVRSEVKTFLQDATFQTVPFKTGEPLVALAEGLGMRRGNPEFRRLSALAPIILDPSDPSVLGQHLAIAPGHEPIHYPGTGESTGAHALLMNSLGDMSVPVSSGIAMARAAGLVNYLDDDPRYGKPINQLLIDTHTAEAVNGLKRHVDSKGKGVHLDLDNFSGGTDHAGPTYPRLDKPLRIGFDKKDALDGYSSIIFPLSNPEGEHGFHGPGEGVEIARKACRDACSETGEDACGCDTFEVFDVGTFLFNMIGRFLGSGGKVLDGDHCLARDDCPDFLPAPPFRTNLK